MRVRIRLAENFRAVFYAPFYATLALGFYADEDVGIELAGSDIPGDGVARVLDGSADITWAGPMRVMKARASDFGCPLVAFGEVVGRDPFCLVGRARAAFRLADLGALRFAAVSEVPTPWLCLQHDLRECGIDPAGVAHAPGRTMAENFEALRQGRLDVVQTFEPFISMAAEQGAGAVLYAASRRGPTTYTTFIARRDSPQRTAFAGMVRAVARMQGWLAEHTGADLAAVTAPYYPGIARPLLAQALERYREAGIWPPSAAVSRQGFGRLAESLVSGGYISRMPRYEDCVDESLGPS
jgi:NitT/TauT family transport system substrate-binding protein